MVRLLLLVVVSCAWAINWNDALFNSTDGWNVNFDDGRFATRYLVTSAQTGNIFTETRVQIAANLSAVVAAVYGRWSWWKGGAQDDWKTNADGSVSFLLWPALIGGLRVGIRAQVLMFPPISWSKTSVRFPVSLQHTSSASTYGDAYFHIEEVSKGVVHLSSRFSGVTRVTILTPTDTLFAVTHLRAESGRVPGLSGTGFVGLYKLLEGRH